MRVVICLIAISFCLDVLWAKPVHLRQNHLVSGDFLKLSDFFVGIPQDKDEEILEAPEAGTSKHYPHVWVVRLAKNFDLNWIASHHKGLVVSKASLPKLSREEAQALVRKFIQKQYPEKLTGGEVDISIEGQYQGGILNKKDACVVGVSWREGAGFSAYISDGKVMSSFVGCVSRVAYVPVLKHAVFSGVEIQPQDIEYIAISSSAMSSAIIQKTDQLVGKLMGRKKVNPGEPVQHKDIVEPIAMKRGDTVIIKAMVKNISISLKGAVQNSASIGQQVKVMNMQSKRIIEGTVQDSQTVIVPIAAK